MNIRIMIAAIALIAAGIAVAELPGPPPGRGAPDIEHIAVLLDLDEGQKTAVKQVLDEQVQQHRAQWQKAKDSGTRPSHEEMQAQHDKMHQETIEKLRPILSDTQLTKFEALTQMHGPGPGAAHKKPE